MSMRERGSTIKSLGERRISLDDVPLFIQYLKVSRDDDDFIENCLNKLQVLHYSDKYLKKGMLFRELLDVLVDCGLLQGMELTEKEMVSTQGAQMIISILLAAGVFGEKAKRKRDKFAMLVNDCNDIANSIGPFNDRRIYQPTQLLVYKF